MSSLAKYIDIYCSPVYQHSCGVITEIKRRKFFNKLLLNISLNDLSGEEDPLLLECLLFLEKVSGQKPCFLKKEYIYVGSKKVFLVNCSVTLRGKRLFYFFEYFRSIINPIYLRRHGLNVAKFNGNNVLTLSYKDLNVFSQIKHKVSKGQLRLTFISSAEVDIGLFLKLLKIY